MNRRTALAALSLFLLPVLAHAEDFYGSKPGGKWIGGDPGMTTAIPAQTPATNATLSASAGAGVTAAAARPAAGAGGAGRTAGQEVSGIPYNAGWDYHGDKPRREFQRKSGFPSGRPGYVIDYIVPLSQGGSKTPDNMRWVKIEDAVADHR